MFTLPRSSLAPRTVAALAALVFAVTPACAQRVDLIRVGDTWRYEKGRADPPTAWTGLAFDDAAWAEGRTGIGYGDGDDITLLADMRNGYITLYARKAFTLDDPGAFRKLVFRLSYDDGFVAYLNGVEVARRGLGSPGTAVNHDTTAPNHEPGVMEVFDLTSFLPVLVAGANVLAVEVHNESKGNDDLSFVPALTAYGQAPGLHRGPYIQLLEETSVRILWETDPATVGAVEYGTTEALGSRVDGGSPSAAHQADLSGLAPGTEYFYRVLADGAALSGVHRLRTAPQKPIPPALASGFRMAVFGDTEKVCEGFLGAARVVETIGPEIALVLGDVIRDGDVDTYVFDNWARVLPSCAFYPTLGNHDAEDGATAYLDTFHVPTASSKTERYYSFDRGDVHFVSLDATGSYGPGSKQYEWLRSDLGATDRIWTIAYLHEAPYSTGTTHGSNLNVRRDLGPVFDEFEVDLVFSGHNHNYERTYPIRGGEVADSSKGPVYTNPPGTIYVVTGGAGGTLYAQDRNADKTYSAIFNLSHHVCQLDVDGRTLSWKAIDIAGAVIETVEIRKPSSEPEPLVLSGLEVVDVRGTSATIRWTTDRPADSEVEYGLEGGGVLDLRASDGAPVAQHSLVLSGLEPKSRYRALARSRDGAGGEAASDTVTFETMDLFLRGDSSGDGELDVSDAIRILLYLFADVSTPPCLDALDADDKGELNLTDAVYLLGFLFLGGPQPPPPLGERGDDPTADGLDCIGLP